MTKFNLDSVINDLKGQPVMSRDASKTDGTLTEMNVKDVITEALLGQYPDEQQLAATEKVKRFRLALQVEKGGEQDFTVDDTKLIKDLIAKRWNALFTGRAYDIIEPPAPPVPAQPAE